MKHFPYGTINTFCNLTITAGVRMTVMQMKICYCEPALFNSVHKYKPVPTNKLSAPSPHGVWPRVNFVLLRQFNEQEVLRPHIGRHIQYGVLAFLKRPP